jgi:hypothetical protein
MRRITMPRMKKTPQPVIVEEVSAGLPEGTLVVYADFEQYKAGDVFVMPEGWARDVAYEELLYTKSKGRQGLCFVNENNNRIVVPVKEV